MKIYFYTSQELSSIEIQELDKKLSEYAGHSNRHRDDGSYYYVGTYKEGVWVEFSNPHREISEQEQIDNLEWLTKGVRNVKWVIKK